MARINMVYAHKIESFVADKCEPANDNNQKSDRSMIVVYVMFAFIGWMMLMITTTIGS